MKLDPEERIFDIATKALVGDEISEEDSKFLRERNARYKMVQFLYLEKVNHNNREDKSKVIDFQFTPRSEWMKMPILDIVNELVELDRKIQSGEIKPQPLDFGDFDLKEIELDD